MNNNLITFTYEKAQETTIFRFEWEFTNDNASSIFEEAKKILIGNWSKNAIFNMIKIEHINSRAAWWIADIYETIEDYSWKVYITNMNEFVKDSLELLWMFLFINHSDSEQNAIKELTK